MKTAIISMWHNEADIAPFFLKHYYHINDIFIILDTDTTDNTLKIIKMFKNTNIIDFTFPKGFDSITKQDKINKFITANEFKKYDWIYILDADEFIWPPDKYQSHEEFLTKYNNYCLIYAAMWQVYKHKDEKPLDHMQCIHLQRRHGDPERFTGFNAHYFKPCIIKPFRGIIPDIGCHKFSSTRPIKSAPEFFDGAHWAMADVEMAIKRRMDKKNRFSERNIELKLGYQNHKITEEQIREMCQQYENDPQLF